MISLRAHLGAVILRLMLVTSLVLCSSQKIWAEESEHQQENPERPGPQINITSDKYRKLFADLKAHHGFEQEDLLALFSDIRVHQKVITLMDNQQQTLPFFNYLSLLFTPALIEKGKEKLVEYKPVLDRIENQLGVDREYVVAIWAIETRFGQNTGDFNVFRTLNTLFAAYPRRSAFFRRELIEYLLLCRENSINPRSLRGSYAGAIGQPQFMPSSFREYAVSFDGDQLPDIFTSVPDILASIANYLRRHHWVLDAPVLFDLGNSLKSATREYVQKQTKTGTISWQQLKEFQRVNLPQPPKNEQLSIIHLEANPLPGSEKHFIAVYPNFRAITAWNHSNRYAMTVDFLARALTSP